MLKALLLSGVFVGIFIHTYSQQNNPMSFTIDGEIVSILKPNSKEKSAVCAKYPCQAKVRIINISNYGSSLTARLQQGDTIFISFAYSLNNTAKVFPKMKAKYPGLKKHSFFTAQVEQRLLPMNKNEFIIYHYSLKTSVL